MAGTFGSSSSADDEMISGINVTPLVDVVLVLLIIFLITAPVIYQSSIQVQLPKATSGEKSEASPLQFSITKEGDLWWAKEQVGWDAISGRLGVYLKEANTPDATAIINADEATPHGTVVKLMDVLRNSGLTRFALHVEGASAQALQGK